MILLRVCQQYYYLCIIILCIGLKIRINIIWPDATIYIPNCPLSVPVSHIRLHQSTAFIGPHITMHFKQLLIGVLVPAIVAQNIPNLTDALAGENSTLSILNSMMIHSYQRGKVSNSILCSVLAAESSASAVNWQRAEWYVPPCNGSLGPA